MFAVESFSIMHALGDMRGYGHTSEVADPLEKTSSSATSNSPCSPVNFYALQLSQDIGTI